MGGRFANRLWSLPAARRGPRRSRAGSRSSEAFDGRPPLPRPTPWRRVSARAHPPFPPPPAPRSVDRLRAKRGDPNQSRFWDPNPKMPHGNQEFLVGRKRCSKNFSGTAHSANAVLGPPAGLPPARLFHATRPSSVFFESLARQAEGADRREAREESESER